MDVDLRRETYGSWFREKQVSTNANGLVCFCLCYVLWCLILSSYLISLVNTNKSPQTFFLLFFSLSFSFLTVQWKLTDAFFLCKKIKYGTLISNYLIDYINNNKKNTWFIHQQKKNMVYSWFNTKYKQKGSHELN